MLISKVHSTINIFYVYIDFKLRGCLFGRFAFLCKIFLGAKKHCTLLSKQYMFCCLIFVDMCGGGKASDLVI